MKRFIKVKLKIGAEVHVNLNEVVVIGKAGSPDKALEGYPYVMKFKYIDRYENQVYLASGYVTQQTYDDLLEDGIL